MIITNIEAFMNGKSKVFIDEQLAFVLYKGELSRYKLRVGEDITAEIYDKILKEVILKRGKARGLYLLQSKERTEQEVRNKLKQNFYPEDIIDQVIDYLISYRYIDDNRYTRMYIEYKSRRRSKAKICQELMQKGISKSFIMDIYEEIDNNKDIELIRKFIEKKSLKEEMTSVDIQKLYQQLFRKGFQYDDIRTIIQEFFDCHKIGN
jgi:Uncharacterized protein conserved in bacteria